MSTRSTKSTSTTASKAANPFELQTAEASAPLFVRPGRISRASAFDEKGIALALFANSGEGTVSGDDDSFIGKSKQCVVQRLQDFLHGAAGQIGAADGTGEKGVAGDEFLFGRKVEADAAFGMAGRVQDGGGV